MVLITTRDPSFARGGRTTYGDVLPPLSEASSLMMLSLNIPSRCYDEAEARTVVRRMGHLPLGIRAVIGLINETNVHLSFANQQWSSPRSILLETDQDDVYHNLAPSEQALADVWFGELGRFEKIDADANELLETVALLDPDVIQEELFVLGSLGTKLENVGFVRNRVRCLRTLKRLMLSNTVTEDSKYQSHNVHRLLQACIHMKMTTLTRQRALSYAATLVANMILSRGEKGVTWAKRTKEFQDFFPHAQSIHQFYIDNKNQDGKALEVPIEFLTLLRKAGE